MANLTLKSQRQIQTDILATLIAELGLNDVIPGSVLDVLTKAIAQEDFAQYAQMSQIVRLVDLNAITGEALDTKAFEFGLERRQPQRATGKVTIQRPATFEKVSTTFYSGSPAPIQGDTIIDVNDASDPLIGSSGTLILGRGTANEEEVDYSVAPIDNTNFFRFTLDTTLSNSHAVEETIILKQGSDEVILAGTQIIVPSTGTSEEIVFTTLNDVTLLAGEDEITGVEVRAAEPGTRGNIALKAINGEEAFSNPPFPGARAVNDQKFTTGRNRETDDELRDRIQEHVQSLSRGVKEAILNAIVGLVDPETAKRVVSANIILPQEEAGKVLVYIDDGTGFEPSFLSQGFEEILRNSTGGETRLQLDLQPVVQAQVENNISEPYNMSGGLKSFTYEVGIQSETINFAPSDFDFPESATAEEIVTAINDKSTLLEARTSRTGERVVVQAKADINEDLQITGGVANSILSFPTDARSTVYIYVNDELVSKDGTTAFLDSGNQGPYNFVALGAFPHTLTLVVDGKTANSQTITFQSADFADPTSITASELATVINSQLAGARALTVNSGTQVRIVSNTELSLASKLEITGGTANTALAFSTNEVSGIDGDYTFNKELGTIEFKEPLPANVSVTSGSKFTRAKVRSSFSENYSPANGTTLEFEIDGNPETVTFDNSFVGGKSAVLTAEFINAQLVGGQATVREIGGSNFIEVSTNTYAEANGSIELLSSSTANGSFGFPEDELKTNQRPHKAFRVSGNSGPYEFAESDNLVIVMNDDIVTSTFTVVMDFDGAVTTGTSTTQFNVSSFSNIFESDDELNDYYAAFTTGANTLTGTVTDVTDQGGDTWRYEFDTLPAGLADYAVGDLLKTTNLVENSNNGFFVITGISTAGNGYVEVTNTSGLPETGSSGTALLSQRRQVTGYDTGTGEITVGSGFSNTPSIGDNAIVIPSTVNNVVQYMNNTKISSLSLKAIIEGVEANTKVQISSKLEGSDGYVQVTGGSANDVLDFETETFRGLEGYNYYTGLLELVHRTIYGDDTDLVSFPGVGAAGVQFEVLAPTVREVDVNINVTLQEGISIASLENEIKSAVTGYLNNLGVGADVIIEEIRARVIRIRGVEDVVLNDPLSNISIADNELARTRESLILIG